MRRGLLTPWGAAGRCYGRYGLPRGELAALGGSELSRLGPVLEVALNARAWLTLNVAAVLAQLVADGVDDVVVSILQGGLVTMVLGPFGVLLGFAILVAVAATRRTATRQLTRPVLIALVTFLVSVGIFGVQLPGVRQAVQSLIDPVVELASEFPFSLVASILGAWLVVFGLCAVYLIHLHGFTGPNTGGGLLDPLVSVWLAWTVALVEIVNFRPDDLPAGTFTTLTLTSATVATLISAWQLVDLHRRGITFRSGPWAAAWYDRAG
jgi:hypothetical protein